MIIAGYMIAIATGWFSWQVMMAIGADIARNDGPFALEMLFIWFQLPLGMLLAYGVAMIWFWVFPDRTGRSASSHANSAGALAMVAAVGSCGWLAASHEDNPPRALFFPIADAVER